MLPYTQKFVDSLKDKSLHFDAHTFGEDDIVTFPYDGKLSMYVFSGEKGEYVHMMTKYETVPDEKYAEVLVACNLLNSQYKWLKFFIDKDNDIMVSDDAIVSEDSCADECFELLVRRIQILEDVKPVIMKAIFG